jgi:hypothetical protein
MLEYRIMVPRSNQVDIHRRNIDRFMKEDDYDMVRVSFFYWIAALRQANSRSHGARKGEFDQAKTEFSEFARKDPLYLAWCEKLLPIIRSEPGILQTELYKRFPAHEKENISYSLYFAADHGGIKRVRTGRTYTLSAEDPISSK